MNKEVFAGRTVLKRLFKDFFIKTIEEEKDSRSFLSFGKQREQDNLTPRVLLFSGENGLGKSAALKKCIAFADNIADESKKTIKVISIDFEELYFKKGRLPTTIKELTDLIGEVVADKSTGLASYFSKHIELNTKIKTLLQTIDTTIVEEWPRQLFVEPASFDLSDLQTNCDEWARKKLNRHDFDLLEKSERKAVELLTVAIDQISSEYPLILAIDGIELLSVDLEQWLCQVFLSSLYEHKNRIMTIVSGSCDFIRGYRCTFPEDFIFSFNFRDIALSTSDISYIASKLHIKTSEEDARKIEEYSAGIPIVIKDVFNYAKKKVPFEELLLGTVSNISNITDLASAIADRFIARTENAIVKGRIFQICMCNQFTPTLFAKLWNVSFSDINNTINELSSECSFMNNKHIHPSVRASIRAYLLQEAALGINSSYYEFFKSFSTASFEFFQDQLTQLNTTLPTMEKRYNDERFCSVVINMFTNMLWTSQEDAFELLPGFYLEMIHFNSTCAIDLLGRLKEFRSVLATESRNVLDLLENGINTASPTVFRNRVPVDNNEVDMLSYIIGCTTLNDEQKSLLYHSLGRLDFRNNLFEDALKHFKDSIMVLEQIDNVQDLIFEDFLMVGYAFISNSKPQLAIESFTQAVQIRPESFLPWFDLGVAQISTNQFENAVDALNKAVSINPDYQDTWHNLGTCYSCLDQHELAVESFTKAIDKGPQSAGLWNEIGNSFQKLGQHEDAVKAFGKVVALESENADAYFLMGKSNSALSISQEAISSFEQAIRLHDNFFEAIESLGMEYYLTGQFEDAAKTLEKAAELQPQYVELWYRIAESYYKADKYEKAIIIGQKAIKCDPNHTASYIIVGRSHTAMSNFRSALEVYTKASELDPSNSETWNEIGNSHYAQSNYSQAIEAFHKAIENNSSNQGTWHSIGLAHQIQEEYDLAVDAFTKATEQKADDFESWFQKGRVHMVLEQFDEAIEAFSKTVELTPDSHDAWFRKGLSYAKTSSHQKAIESFVKAVELWRSDSDIWYNLGLSYAALGFNEEAIEAFTEATTLSPAHFKLYYNLGVCLQELSKYEEAIAAFSKALELQPDNIEAIGSQAKCLYHLSRYEEAKGYFITAIENAPEDTDSLYFLALTCHAIGSFEEAIKYYSRITDVKPDFTEAWFNTAVAHHALESYLDAINIYVQLVNKDPEYGAAWYNLGIAYHAVREFENAIKSYREVTRIDPDKPDSWYQMGIAFHTMEHYGEAIQAYRKVIQIVPTHINALFNLGLAYNIWHTYDDAIDSFKRVIEIKPDHFDALSNLSLSYYNSGNYTGCIESAEKSLTLKSDEQWLYSYLIASYAMKGNSTKANDLIDTLLKSDSSTEDISRTYHLLKKALTKNPVEEAEIILRKLDTIMQEQSAVDFS